MLGTRQHGLPRFAVAELPEDAPALEAAREEVLTLLREHGSLDAPELGPLLEAARRRFGAGAADPIPRTSELMRVDRGRARRAAAGRAARLEGAADLRPRPRGDLLGARRSRRRRPRARPLLRHRRPGDRGALARRRRRDPGRSRHPRRRSATSSGSASASGSSWSAPTSRAGWRIAKAGTRSPSSISSSSTPLIDSPTAWGRNSTAVCRAFSARADGR